MEPEKGGWHGWSAREIVEHAGWGPGADLIISHLMNEWYPRQLIRARRDVACSLFDMALAAIWVDCWAVGLSGR